VGSTVHGQAAKIVGSSAGIAKSDVRPSIAGAVAVALFAIALAGGAYGPVALGVLTAAIWIGIVAYLLLARPLPGMPKGFIVAAVALAVITLMTAVSLSWSNDPGSGFADLVRWLAYLGAFVLAGLTLGRANGASALVGLAVGVVAIATLALASRLFGLGAGDVKLAAEFGSAAGRLSYPIGYWNGLGSLMAMAVPVLGWIAASASGRRQRAVALAGFVPVVLAMYMATSRGALLAAIAGIVVMVALAINRSQSFAAAVVGLLVALPGCIAASVGAGMLSSAWAGTGSAELGVAAAAAFGLVLAFGPGPATVRRLAQFRIPGVRLIHVLAVLGIALAAVVLVVGPGALIGDFTEGPAADTRLEDPGGLNISASGSGRAQFWKVAIEAFADDPVRGIGAGSYADYWNQNGSLDTPTINAHSEPLELLAELGPLALIAFILLVGIALVGGVRVARADPSSPATGLTALLVAGLVGVLIDWTWDIPAVAVPLLIAAALLLARPPSDAQFAPAPRRDRGQWIFSAPTQRIQALGVLGLVGVSVAALWSGGVLAVAAIQIDRSDAAYDRGQLDDAAAAARTAAIIEPWSAVPWSRLATIEQAAGNLDAARRDTAMAIEKTPEDFRLWLLATILSGQVDEQQIAAAYSNRALTLAPQVLPRVLRALQAQADSGP
jgi:hypothetical protein